MNIKDINLDDYELIDIKYKLYTNEEIEMVDIQVQDNETFFIEDDILTHNSAISSFVEIRDPEIQAGMPLRGKLLNVYGKSITEIMENKEILDILTAINLEFNEQQGDWVIPKDAKFYKVKYKSLFELDDKGEVKEKEVYVQSYDRFFINRIWVPVYKLIDNYHDTYIESIEEVDIDKKQLSNPDYFHFRRLWDTRGFRKIGKKYKVKLGRDILYVSEFDEVLVDKKWVKVSKIKDKEEIDIDSDLTYIHKKLKPAFTSKLKFSKIHIATDSDPDGSSIMNLLINLFHEFFPELFWDESKPFISRITFPMIAATKGKQVKYYANRKAFEDGKEKGEIDDTWKIAYYKGLGSMEKRDWKYIFDNLEKYTFNIYDDGYVDNLMTIFFDSDANVRKNWLEIND